MLPGMKSDSMRFAFFLLSAHEYSMPYQSSLSTSRYTYTIAKYLAPSLKRNLNYNQNMLLYDYGSDLRDLHERRHRLDFEAAVKQDCEGGCADVIVVAVCSLLAV